MFTHQDKIAILGRSGSGKTTLARRIQSLFPRMLVIDRMGEYAPEAGTWVVTGASNLRRALAQLRGLKVFRVIYRFRRFGGDPARELDRALEVAYENGNVAVNIDEVQAFCTPSHVGPGLAEMVFTGRHRKCPLIVTSQRPARVAKDIFANTSYWYCGQIWEPHDVAYLHDVMGPIAGELHRVPEFHFLEYAPALRRARIVSNR